jgi:hypothetical protein
MRREPHAKETYYGMGRPAMTGHEREQAAPWIGNPSQVKIL